MADRSAFSRDYFSFYLQGRESPFQSELDQVDLAPLAERVLAGENPRAVADSAAEDLAKKFQLDGTERQWAKRKANREEIDACGGDAALAFKMYLWGMTDTTAAHLEIDLLDEADEIANAADDEPEDDDDGDDADDDEGDGD